MRKPSDAIIIESRRAFDNVVLVARHRGRRTGGASFWLAQAERVRMKYDHMREHEVVAEDGLVAVLRSIDIYWMCRRRGLGARLVHLGSRLARKSGAIALYVHSVNIDGTDPAPFYRSCGFTVIRSNSDSNHYMKKLLTRVGGGVPKSEEISC